MKKVLFAAAFALTGCQSVEWTSVASNEIVGNGGDAVGVIQVSTIGVTAIFHLIDIVPNDLDKAVNKVLVAEAKNLGATKVQLLSATTTPRSGYWALWGTLIGLPTSTAVGIAVK